MDEDYYALSKLARTVFGTNDLDHRRHFHGGMAEETEAAGAMRVTYQDVERAGAILLVDLDAEQEVPILHLRIRKAAARGADVFVIHPRRTRLWDVAEHVACRPGQEASVLEEVLEGSDRGSPLARVRAALSKAGTSAVVLAGAGLAEHPLGPDLALRLAGKFGARSRTRAPDATPVRSWRPAPAGNWTCWSWWGSIRCGTSPTPRWRCGRWITSRTRWSRPSSWG